MSGPAEESAVSVWIARVGEAASLQAYLHVAYNEDGDSIDSEFEQQFGIKFYDRDLLESEFVGPHTTVAHEISEFSYGDQISPQFENVRLEFDSVILIYDFDYSAIADQAEAYAAPDPRASFLGVARYTAD